MHALSTPDVEVDVRGPAWNSNTSSTAPAALGCAHTRQAPSALKSDPFHRLAT